MTIKSIDLYDVFGIERTNGATGVLTCYLPSSMDEVNGDRVYPAILIMPGGAYRFVSGREAEPIALQYLTQGYAAFVLEYSVAPLQYPTAFLEAAMAMIYIRENAVSLAIDPQKVVGIGFSAGGHLCACLGTLFGDSVITNKFGNRAKDVRPDALILSYPVVTSIGKSHIESFTNICGEDEKQKKKLSLETCVSADSSPAFIWYTRNDVAVPVQNSLLLAMAYESMGVDFALHIFERGIHGLSTADVATYRSDNIPDASTGVASWIGMSIDWLADRGIVVEDT